MKKIGVNKTFAIKDVIRDAGVEPLDQYRLNNGYYWNKNLTYNNYNIDKKSINENSLVTTELLDGSKVFFDIVFDANLPYTKLPPDKLTDLAAISTLEIESKFVLFNETYETFANSDDVEELDLLNYYVFLSRNIKKSDDLEKIISNGFRIDPKLLDNESTTEEYFYEYANTFGDWRQEYTNKYKSNLRNIFLDRRDVDKFASSFKYKNLFTKYIKLDLYKDPAGSISNSLEETRMNLRFLSRLYNSIENIQPLQFYYSLSYLGQEVVGAADITTPITKTGTEVLPKIDYLSWVNESITGRNTDITAYFNFNDDSETLIIGTTENTDVPSTSDNSFLANLYSRILAGKTQFIIDKNLRTYEDVLKGKKCYSEVVAYRIIKRARINNNPGPVLQVYYFENNSSELLEFIDTQVKNNKDYIYDIDYYVAVLGNQYSYVNKSISATSQIATVSSFVPVSATVVSQPLNLPSITIPTQTPEQQEEETTVVRQRGSANDFTRAVPEEESNVDFEKPLEFPTIKTTPLVGRFEADIPVIPTFYSYSIKNDPLLYIFPVRATNLIEEFIEDKTTKVVQKPPLTPIVTPIPFKDDRKRIRFSFMQTIGQDIGKYTVLDADDEKAFASIKSSQKPPNDEKILFETETRNGIAQYESFEIYKTETPPLKLNDFNGKLLITLENSTEKNIIVTAYDDFLEPNKKYYYMFRSKNTTGIRSNPTNVYEIEMVINSSDSDYVNSGMFYAIIKPYIFPEESGASKEHTFKQYIKIEPAFEQKLVRGIEDLESTPSPTFGDVVSEQERIWGKTYKIRIKSKQTGRSFDTNFVFDYTARALRRSGQ